MKKEKQLKAIIIPLCDIKYGDTFIFEGKKYIVNTHQSFKAPKLKKVGLEIVGALVDIELEK